MAETAYLGAKRSPTALTIVVLTHGAALGALALAKMDVLPKAPPPIEIFDIRNPPPTPEPKPVEPIVQPRQIEVVTRTPPIIDVEPRVVEVDDRPAPFVPDPYIQPGPERVIAEPSPPPPPPPSPAPEPKKIQPARAKANLGSYVSDADYPDAAMRGEEQGTTRFRLTVGPDGRVQQCAVTGSSGSSSLDATTCRLMKSRARFTPARDSSGGTTGDTVNSSIRWVLPE
jgi:protein TonB